MFEKKTTIVVGAGASAECLLPTGLGLKQRITQLLDIRFDHGTQIAGDHTICDALRLAVKKDDSSARDINPYLHAAWRIVRAIPQAISIDNYIDAHQGDSKLELCGKLAIVRSILDAERNSLLYFSRANGEDAPKFAALQETWFNAFLQLLTENCGKKGLPDRLSSIAIINFNYDRCIEQFLFYALQNYYDIPADEAAGLVKQIEIFHPYGMVGALPFFGEIPSEFGMTPSAPQLLDLAGQIKTFTEGTDPAASDIIAIRNRMMGSQMIVWLGFAFHRQNLALLRPETGHPNPKEVRYFGSAFGISGSDCSVIQRELAALAGADRDHIELAVMSCSDLFRNYRRSLSLS